MSVIDDEVGDAIRLTLIATGFPESKAKPAPVVEKSRKEVPSPSVRTISSLFSSRKNEGNGFEETRLQAPGKEKTDLFRGVPKTAYDLPAIYRKRQQE